MVRSNQSRREPFFHVLGGAFCASLLVIHLTAGAWILPAIGALLATTAVLLRKRKPPLWLSAIAAALLLSWVSVTLCSSSNAGALSLSGQDFSVRAVTVSVERSGAGEYALLKVLAQEPSPRELWNKRVSVFRSDGLEVKPGDVVEYRGRFVSEPDSRAMLLSQGIALESFYGSGAPEVVGYDAGSSDVALSIVRQRLSGVLVKALPLGDGAQLAQIIFGGGGAVSSVQRSDWARSGIAHILAVSGLHLSMMAAMLDVCLRPAKLSPRRKIYVFFAVILLFMGLCGFKASVVRAGIMAIACKSGALFGRESDAANLLGFTAFVMTAFNPYLVLQTGFMLSYLSTMGIVLLSNPMSDWLIDKGLGITRAGRFVVCGISACASAMLVSAPVLCYSFGELSVIAPLTNLLAIPLASVFVGFGMATAFMGLFGLPAVFCQFLAIPAGLSLRALEAIASFFGGFDWSAVRIRHDWWLVWLAAAAIAVVSLVRCGACRRVAALCCLTLTVCALAGSLSYRIFWDEPLLVGVVDTAGCAVAVWRDQAALIGVAQGEKKVRALQTCLRGLGVKQICMAAARDEGELLEENAARLLDEFCAQNRFGLKQSPRFSGKLFGWADISGDGSSVRISAAGCEIVRSFRDTRVQAHVLISADGGMFFAQGVELPVIDRYDGSAFAAIDVSGSIATAQTPETEV